MSRKKSETFEERWSKLHEELEGISDKEVFLKRQDFLLRISRAISWFDRAKQLRQMRKEDVEGTKNDLDTQFIFFWISFNALYARDPLEYLAKEGNTERERFEKYFRNLLKFDNKASNQICKVIENTKAVIKLLENRFIDPYFWDYYHKHPLKRGGKHPNWEKKRRTKGFNDAKKSQSAFKMLSIIFGRLYTLRNQIMHGGSAWKEDLSRGQLREATGVMYKLLPVFIDLMLENPEADWGCSFYPRVEGKPIINPEYLRA